MVNFNLYKDAETGVCKLGACVFCDDFTRRLKKVKLVK